MVSQPTRVQIVNGTRVALELLLRRQHQPAGRSPPRLRRGQALDGRGIGPRDLRVADDHLERGASIVEAIALLTQILNRVAALLTHATPPARPEKGQAP